MAALARERGMTCVVLNSLGYDDKAVRNVRNTLNRRRKDTDARMDDIQVWHGTQRHGPEFASKEVLSTGCEYVLTPVLMGHPLWGLIWCIAVRGWNVLQLFMGAIAEYRKTKDKLMDDYLDTHNASLIMADLCRVNLALVPHVCSPVL